MLLLEEWVVHCTYCSQPFCRVTLQHTSKQLFRFIGNVSPLLGIKFQCLAKNVFENLGVRVSLKRRVSTKEHIKDDTKTPHVTFLPILALQHFRGHVVGSSNNGVHLFSLGHSLVPLREAEVDQLHLRQFRLVSHQVVFGLQIPVDDLLIMQVFHGAEHLGHQGGSVVLVEFGISNDAIKKFTTRAILHDDVDVAVIHEGLVELDDVGVVDTCKNEQLFFEMLDVLFD
jgi:hypothetical protein